LQKSFSTFHLLPLLVFLFLFADVAYAQQIPEPIPGSPVTLQNAPQRDTSNKTNTSSWTSERAVITYRSQYSEKRHAPDTGLQFFHRRLFTRSWLRNLGNHGSPVVNMLFTPEYRVGPSLGYHVFDAYRFNPDSLRFYNTTRPYSSFTYQLGSRAEQTADLLHTQNIRPNWNFAIQYRKITSPGYFKVQRTNHDLGSLTSNYQSLNQRYQLFGSFVYNKLQHDENGGIVADSFLSEEAFDDRLTIPVRYQQDDYSTRRSSVTTLQRDFSFQLRHGYTWGRTDTLFNEDSTRYTFKLIPRFSIAHRLKLASHKYQFKDLLPDSLQYIEYFRQGFRQEDSLFTEQRWAYVDNGLTLNGFLGPAERQLLFSAGIGNRFDRFTTDFARGTDREDVISNYITGELKKEALEDNQWSYNANAKFFFTGSAAGNLDLSADINKEISEKIGSVAIGFGQRIQNAPYSYTIYQNQYFKASHSYNKETVTRLFATVNNDPLRLGAGIRNYLLTNYIYINESLQFDQSADAFNITQIWLKKAFTLGIWSLDNEVVYQQKAGAAPINIPAVMGRHQLSLQTYLFGNALKVATGFDVRWHTPYEPAGYAPLFNRFHYQDSYTAVNAPEVAVFFNFKIKNFRAYVMGDQLQQLFTPNVVNAPGYPAQDAMIRFGFNWVMIN